METNRLRQFRAVYESKNLRKAAEILGLSHSALSKSLKVLQAQLGKQLLIQKGRNIEITEEGHDFFKRLQVFLEAEESLLLPSLKRNEVLRIGTFETFSTHLLGQEWGKYFPSLELELHELLPGDIEAAVASGVIDLGITYEPIPRAGIDFLFIGKVQMKIYVRVGSFPRALAQDLPFVAPVAPVSGTPSGAKGLDGWPDHKFPRQVRFKVGMMETGLALVRAGEAAVFIAAFVANHHNRTASPEYQLVERALPKGMKPVERKIYLILRNSSEEDKNAKRLATLLRKECLSQ